MTPAEEKQLTETALKEACSRLGVNAEKVAAEIHLRVLPGGEVAPTDSVTGYRKISLRADQTWQTVEEAVSDLVQLRPDIRPAPKPAAADTRFGVPAAIFNSLNPGAKMQLARKNGVAAKGKEVPHKRTPTAEEAEAMSGMSATQKMAYARRVGICA